jgi:ABC-type Fe3+/spermidine/putrescine transport system ATPase subunit
MKVLVRPERITLSYHAMDCENRFRGTLKRIVYLGSNFEYVAEVKGGAQILIHSPNREDTWFELNKEIWLGWSREDVVPLR